MDWRNLTPADLSAMSRQVNEARGIDMTNVVQFPSKAKPRPVLVVPTSDLIVQLWGQLHDRIRAHHSNPTDHNERMMAAARARYVAALIEEQEPA